MIAVRLREAMERHRRLTGHRVTYRHLAELTGISESTLQSIAARRHYNTTLDTVDRIAVALQCPLGELLEHLPQPDGLPTSSSGGAAEGQYGPKD